MKQYFLLAAVTLVFGCQPAPIIVNNRDDECHHHPVIVERERAPIVIEQQRPPVIIQQQQQPPVIIQQQPPVIRGCTPHSHCGCCPVCRSNGWTTGIGIHFERGRVGIDMGLHHHHD
jgi:hypothetical protein